MLVVLARDMGMMHADADEPSGRVLACVRRPYTSLSFDVNLPKGTRAVYLGETFGHVHRLLVNGVILMRSYVSPGWWKYQHIEDRFVHRVQRWCEQARPRTGFVHVVLPLEGT